MDNKPSIKKNYMYSMAYQVLIMVLPLITAPYLSRVVGAEGTGIYSYTYSIAQYFVYFIYFYRTKNELFLSIISGLKRMIRK